MPKRFRITVFALGLALSWTPLVVHGQQGEETDSQGQAEPDQPSADRFAIPVEIIEDKAEVEARKSREERSQQRELDDLAAQQGMNEATQKMADYALYQTVLVGIGTALLLYTLWLTRQANKAAVDAATAAEQQAKIAEALERPYLYVDVDQTNFDGYSTLASFEIDHDVEGEATPAPGIIFTIHNYGRAPAIIAEVRAGFCLNDDVPVLDVAMKQRLPRQRIIQANGKTDAFEIALSMPNTMDFTEYVFRLGGGLDQARLSFFGIIQYKSFVGPAETFETEFLWLDDRSGAFDMSFGPAFSDYPERNRAT